MSSRAPLIQAPTPLSNSARAASGKGQLPAEQAVDGVSLVPVLKGKSIKERPLYWHYPHYHHNGIAPSGAIRRGRYKLIEWFEGSIGKRPDRSPFELYDLENDPHEVNNLADDPRCAKVLEELKTKLKAFQERTKDPWILKWKYE